MISRAILETIFNDRSLFRERNFVRRFDAIELLEGELGVDAGLGSAGLDSMASAGSGSTASAGSDSMASSELGSIASAGLGLWAAEAAQVKAALEEVDDRLFARLRAEIAAGWHRGDEFEELLVTYCGVDAAEESGYDMLDLFVNRLCSFLPMPLSTQTLEAEMVDFHKTPVRVVLELAQRIGPGDVFVDLGAGLGQVVLLVHLLTGVPASGVEIEPAFCRYACDCAAGLGLGPTGLGLPGAFDPDQAAVPAGVAFVEGDARFANYSEGTVFFMYTPFTGELLETVFELLRREGLSRPFTLVTYGPCTMSAARQSWLRATGALPDGVDKLGIFRATGETSE